MSGKKSSKTASLEQLILRCTRSGNMGEFHNYLKESRNEILSWKHARSGETCLLLCARYGHIDILRYLVEECDESLEQRNNDGKRALHEAALGGHLQCVKYLISRNVEIDCLKRADWTPLMLACTKDSIEIIQELVKVGANPKLLNKDGWNCFHIAVREGHVEIVQHFLDVFPNVWDTVSNNGRTPLHTAALHGHLKTVELLLKCSGGYLSDSVDSCGSTPLMDSLRGNHIDIASLLITKYNANLNAMDKLGRQCVHISAQSGCLLSLKFLHNEANVDVHNSTDYSRMTPLHVAAKEGHSEVVKFLLDTGSEINRQDCNGRTALHLASAAGQILTVSGLTTHHECDVTLRDMNGLTAMDLALKPEIKEIFMRHKEDTKLQNVETFLEHVHDNVVCDNFNATAQYE